MVSKSETLNHNHRLACALSTRAARSRGRRSERASSHSLKGRAPVTRVGLEAGPLSRWLHAGLVRPGFEAVYATVRYRRILAFCAAAVSRRASAGASLVKRGTVFRHALDALRGGRQTPHGT